MFVTFYYLMCQMLRHKHCYLKQSSSFRSVVVITCASHAQGPRFDPGRKQLYIFFYFIIFFFVSLLFYTV
jgi:uncharacterized membrane protein YcaP (DUF421 family)